MLPKTCKNFRKDRIERNEAFIPFFREHVNNDLIDRFFMSGHKAGLPRHEKIEFIGEKEEDKQRVLQYCRDNNMVLFTAVNGVHPFMKELEADLSF